MRVDYLLAGMAFLLTLLWVLPATSPFNETKWEYPVAIATLVWLVLVFICAC